MGTEKTGDHGCTVGSKQLPRRIALRELGELENLGDGGHASILKEHTDIR